MEPKIEKEDTQENKYNFYENINYFPKVSFENN